MKPYTLLYTVPAVTRMEAITNAVTALRTGVTLLGIVSATATAGAYWDVALRVHEKDDWTEDAEGYVVAPLVNRGTLDAD